jgi:hypothetical protein
MSVYTYPCGKFKLKYVPFEEAIKHLSGIAGEEFIAEAEVLHSDLLPGKYEGWLVGLVNILILANICIHILHYSSRRNKFLTDDDCPLGCCAMQSGRYRLTFQR